MKSLRLLALAAPMITFQATIAQTKTTEQVSQGIAVAQKMKNIFGKKNNQKDPSSNKETSTTQTTNANRNISHIKAGEVSATAKFIDVDEMGHFSLGAAWVRKGQTQALIDTAGNLIVPFGKYGIMSEGLSLPGLGAEKYCHGIFKARELSTNRKGYLNFKGSFLPLPTPNSDYGQMCGEYIAVKNANGTYTYIDHDWNKFQMDKPLGDFRFGGFREGVAVSYTAPQRNGAKLGYKTINNQFVIAPQFDFADAFWEGRAIVGKVDQYGEMKYGFIDKTGREIFPCVLSAMPRRFSSGLARIEPKDKTEFDYAYIDRAGKIVIRRKITDGIFNQFYKGYAVNDGIGRVMDITGKTISWVNFLQKFGIEDADAFFFSVEYEDPYYLEIVDEILTDKIMFRARLGLDRHCMGFLDINKKDFVKAVFEKSESIRFDKTARLSYAKMVIGTDKTYGRSIYREGYINTDGVFVIVKKESSPW